MEVLKHGNRPFYTAECPVCGCTVRFCAGEAFTAFDDGGYEYVVCPECHFPITDAHFRREG